MTIEAAAQPAALTHEQYVELFDLYVTARNNASLAARFSTWQRIVDSHAADKAFTDALQALVTP